MSYPSPVGGGGQGAVAEMPKALCLCVICLVSACSSVTLVIPSPGCFKEAWELRGTRFGFTGGQS